MSAPLERERQLLEAVLFELKKVIVGQDRIIVRLLTCLLARGHCLVEGLPGLAKTLTAETLAQVVGGTSKRIQFTPDLVPADILGTRIYRASAEAFDVELGPIFANFVVADEINRAPARVHSALLEVMSQAQVTIAGTTYPVPSPFMVLGTQNPIESEGVFLLPEAQQDRFLMKLVIGYPEPSEEREIVRRMGVHPPTPGTVLDPKAVRRLQAAADAVYVDDQVQHYIVDVVTATRQPEAWGLDEVAPLIMHGASPRASLGLAAAGRAHALLRGRGYVLPGDVREVAPDVLRHRLVLSYEALAGRASADLIIDAVLDRVDPPLLLEDVPL